MHLDPPAGGKLLVRKESANTGLLDGVDVVVLSTIGFERGGHELPHLNGTDARAMPGSEVKQGQVSGVKQE
jgi:hypothetical protein